MVGKTIALVYLLSGQTNVSACQLCTKGHYCPRTGMAEPAGLCSPGYWCSLGSWSAEPITVGNDTGLLGCQCPATSRGGPCMPGYYCPQGASRPTACDPGKYCANWTLSAPMGLCSAGYYCNSTASSDTPMDGVTGNLCPKGHYCREGICSFRNEFIIFIGLNLHINNIITVIFIFTNASSFRQQCSAALCHGLFPQPHARLQHNGMYSLPCGQLLSYCRIG